MAKLKHTPKSYAEAAEVLGNRTSRKLGNNTWLERDRLDVLVVRLHGTYIVHFHKDGAVILHTGGYRTVTTKDRINQFIKGRVYQKNYAWFFTPRISDVLGGFAWGKPISFTEGINVGRGYNVQA